MRPLLRLEVRVRRRRSLAENRTKTKLTGNEKSIRRRLVVCFSPEILQLETSS